MPGSQEKGSRIPRGRAAAGTHTSCSTGTTCERGNERLFGLSTDWALLLERSRECNAYHVKR